MTVHDSTEPVEWAGRTFGQLSADEKRRATKQAAARLQAELQANAPVIAQVLADMDVAEHRQIENEQEPDMTVQPTLEYRTAGTDEDWTRIDPADRKQWQWRDAPDWLAAEALWLMGEGCEVRLVSTGIDTAAHPHMQPEHFGDYTEVGCLSLNPPGDDPPVPGTGQPNAEGTGAYRHQMPDREHIVRLSAKQAEHLRRWMRAPVGGMYAGRAGFESVSGGGIMVRTKPCQPVEA